MLGQNMQLFVHVDINMFIMLTKISHIKNKLRNKFQCIIIIIVALYLDLFETSKPTITSTNFENSRKTKNMCLKCNFWHFKHKNNKHITKLS